MGTSKTTPPAPTVAEHVRMTVENVVSVERNVINERMQPAFPDDDRCLRMWAIGLVASGMFNKIDDSIIGAEKVVQYVKNGLPPDSGGES